MGKWLLLVLPFRIHSSFSYDIYAELCHVLCSSATRKAANVKNNFFFSERETRSCFLSCFMKVKSSTGSKPVGFSFPIPHMSLRFQKVFLLIWDWKHELLKISLEKQTKNGVWCRGNDTYCEVTKPCFCKLILFWFSTRQPGYKGLYGTRDWMVKVWPGFGFFIFLSCPGVQQNRLLGVSSNNA